MKSLEERTKEAKRKLEKLELQKQKKEIDAKLKNLRKVK